MEDEGSGVTGTEPVLPGKVNEIRRQWAVHEDEALAYRLQNEEITQHYCGNRTRNAIVREDTPRAREEQKREEQQALEDRLRHLQLQQQQAEEDARLAMELADRFDKGLEPGSLLNNAISPAVTSIPVDKFARTSDPIPSCSHASVTSFPKINNNLYEKSFGGNNRDPSLSPGSTTSSGSEKKTKSIMKPAGSYRDKEENQDWAGAGACGYSGSSPPLPGTSLGRSYDDKYPNVPYVLGDEEQRILQEKLDEELAMKLQEELEQAEIDKRIAVEAQDHELAKMIHQKEKERLRRAKEKAKQKAAALAAANAAAAGSSPLSPGSPVHEGHYDHSEYETTRTPSRSSSGTTSGDAKSPSWSDKPPFGHPPKIPEKNRVDRDDPFSFRAAPRALPPQPPLIPTEIRRFHPAPMQPSLYIPPDEPVPPYMPLQGLQNLQKKRNK